MKKLYIPLLSVIAFSSVAQEINNTYSNINFETKPTQIAYNNETEMVAHLKNYKSQTYKYYIKLDSIAKDKVYQNHIKNSDKNITNIILELYLEKS